MKVNIKNVRALYPFLFSKDQPKKADQDPKYRVTLTMEEDHPGVEQIREAALEVLTAKVGADAAERWMKNNFGVDKKTGVLHWGDKRDEPSEDFDATRYFTAKSDSQPVIQTSLGAKQKREGMVRDEDGDDIELDRDEHGKQIYAGCFVNASINVVAWKNDNGTGVSTYLLGIKFRKDGDEQQLGETVGDDDLDDDDEDVAPPKKVAAPAKKKK